MDDGGGLTEAAVGKFLELTDPYEGSVSMDSPARWTATISLEAPAVAEAVDEAIRVVTLLAAEAGLPVWPVVRAEAIRSDLVNGDNPR
jgi:hypothetical protein